MTTPSQISSDGTRQCAVFEERLAAWLEGELADAECAMMDRHRGECVTCAALVADIDEIVQEAKTLPSLTPSRDLWHGIEARLGAPVISLDSRREETAAAVPERRGSVSVRWFAVAAAVLVAVSSGVTWTVARMQFEGSGNSVIASGAGRSDATASPRATPVDSALDSAANTSTNASPSTVAVAPSAPNPSSAPAAALPPVASAGASARRAVGNTEGGASVRNASSMSDVDAIYEREIAALRRIVNQRLTELDPETVAALRENLRTIDKAISDSRRALQSDPRSGLLSTELDRTLEAKLALMRRVALL